MTQPKIIGLIVAKNNEVDSAYTGWTKKRDHLFHRNTNGDSTGIDWLPCVIREIPIAQLGANAGGQCERG